MALIDLQAFASNHTHQKTIKSSDKIALFCDAQPRRRNGIIINKSQHTLFLWFGDNPPPKHSEWLAIPHYSNCDIPFLYTGKIWGVFAGIDERSAQIFELYGNFI